ncbi:hypothetical protein [Candidatus Methylacidithermus pantelleriae]|uniref:hypothetical protein n=1 Tax=Candidatus Methylacidithermus pantelleriae TaxID=2744239 RepID=UPI00157C6CE4|nr:hypothetical protein [Candidatus Methylacidithermus pantelleriae]
MKEAFRKYGYDGALVSQIAEDLGLKDQKARQALWVWIYYNAKKGQLVRDGKKYRLVDLWEQ